MLVITRRDGQWLHLITASGEKISIGLTQLAKKYAAIGIEAPASAAVVRDELYEEMKAKGVDVTSAAAILADRAASHKKAQEGA